MDYLLLTPLLIGITSGFIVWLEGREDRRIRDSVVISALSINFVVSCYLAVRFNLGIELHIHNISDQLRLYLCVDEFGRLCALFVTSIWLLIGIYSTWYMDHKGSQARFFCFYLIAGGILPTVCYAGNFFTFYVFFEAMTLLSSVLVLHDLDRDSVNAALKYIFYSMAGALITLYGFFLLVSDGVDTTFTPGGVTIHNGGRILLFPAILMVMGFGTKAGMFPMHGWLSTAHPVAPAPASAVLSGAIAKMGVVGIVRSIYYIMGPDTIRGTWVQYTWIALSLTTILMGSVMAYREDILKKRIAYSTVSQVSYVLFGLALLNGTAMTGALMQMFCHAFIKAMLFAAAGVIIVQTGRKNVSEMSGMGKVMPVTMWCFTISAVSLVGIPPTSPFLGKWYIAIGSLSTDIPVVSWLGPVILLVSALLTAGYLLTMSIDAFLGDDNKSVAGKKKGRKKGTDGSGPSKLDPPYTALIPIIIMTLVGLILGIWSSPILDAAAMVAAAVM